MADTSIGIPGVQVEAGTNPFQGLNEGLQQGVKLAALQEQVANQRAQLEIQKQEHRDKVISGAFDMLPKILNSKGKAKDYAFQIFTQRMNMIGVPVDPAIKDLIGTQNPNVIPIINAQIRANPELAKNPEFMNFVGKTLETGEAYMDWEKNFLSQYLEGQRKSQSAELTAAATAGSREYTAALASQKAEQDRRQKFITEGVNPEAETNPEIAKQEAEKIAGQKQAKIDAEIAQKAAQAQKAVAQSNTEAGKLADREKNTESLIKFREGLLKAKNYGVSLAGARLDLAKDRLDQSVHQKVLAKLKGDTVLSQRLSQYGNLTNALSVIADAKSLTPQQISEFQQSVRSNLGIKGVGGVDEREKTYINTLGLTFERWAQFLTGDPASISKDSNLVQHFIDLANLERKSIGGIMDKRISALAAGNASVYKRRPDLKSDLIGVTEALKSQYQEPAAPQAAPQAAPSTAPVNVDALRQQAQAAIKAGKDPTAVKNLFKQKTGQEL